MSKSITPERLARCRSVHRPDDWNKAFRQIEEELTFRIIGNAEREIGREAPILRRAPQSAPERRDGPPWVLLAFCSAVFWGIAAYLLLY